LQGKKALKDYFLVGGTALALQIGHRMSYDIDLFTRDDLNKDEIYDLLNRDYNGNYQVHNVQNTVLQVDINKIKVDFVKYDYNLLENVKIEDGVKYLGIKDISAMKLKTVANRGDQAKDFFDVYYLLKEMSMREMFENYKQKYNQKDTCPIKRSLIYFDDVTDSNWASVKLLKEPVSADEVKRAIADAVNNSNGVIYGG
jgi:predicted nucleotidyltransferase component of viral defense system